MTTSYVTVACLSDRRWFDLDAVRTAYKPQSGNATLVASKFRTDPNYAGRGSGVGEKSYMDGAGAPPLDWWDEPADPPQPQGNVVTRTTVTLTIGDVRDVMKTIPDQAVDCLITSPPFLALRSYLPSDHADKDREIGSEPTPAAFLDTLLELSAEWRRLLVPTGSLAVELGDTYSGSGGAGGDYGENGLRDGQQRFNGAAAVARAHVQKERTRNPGPGWPLAKSLTGIPTLYPWSLAYGRNLLTGATSPAGQWRIRNLLVWTRPNPPVGALGDKFRPATSYVTVACTSDRRWFDLDAVRQPHAEHTLRYPRNAEHYSNEGYAPESRADGGRIGSNGGNPAGAPPLDWWHDDTPDWQPLHRLPTAPYHGAHYACYPVTLPRRLIEAMCPREVCVECGEPRRRLTSVEYVKTQATSNPSERGTTNGVNAPGADPTFVHGRANRVPTTLGWSHCGHTSFRSGRVFDPFSGSGTTGVAAALCGRSAILIDIDERNVDLTRQRLADHCRIVTEDHTGDTWKWTVETRLPNQKTQLVGQSNLFDHNDGEGAA